MHDVLGREQSAAVVQILENDLVGIVNEHTLVLAGLSGMATLAVNRNHDRNIVLLADDKVVSTEARSGMNTAGTCIKRYVVTNDNERLTVVQRMLCLDHFQIGAEAGRQNFPLGNACGLHDGRDKLLRHDVNLAGRNLNEIVLKDRIQRNCKVARNGPGRSRPDYEVNVLLRAKQLRDNALVIGNRELDEDRLARNVLVLDFRFSQSGFIVRAPVNRLLTLVDVTLLGHLAENLNLSSLVVVGQGQIRAIPVANNAQTLELRALRVYVVMCKLLTLGTELSNRNLAAIHAISLDGLTLDRQTVSIPARDIRRLIPHHIARTDDEILENLVQGVAHVQIAVCIRRAVVQNEEWLALVLLHQFMVEICLLPVLKKTRLALGKTRTHREICLRQIDRVIVILLHWQYSFLSVIA